MTSIIENKIEKLEVVWIIMGILALEKYDTLIPTIKVIFRSSLESILHCKFWTVDTQECLPYLCH